MVSCLACTGAHDLMRKVLSPLTDYPAALSCTLGVLLKVRCLSSRRAVATPFQLPVANMLAG